MAPRTRSQLATKLAARDIPPDIAAAVLDRYTEVGLVDDTAFAAAWVRSRHGVRGLAGRAVAQELRHRGVRDDVAAEALVVIDAESERDAARRLVERRLRTTAGLERQARTRRLVGMLARKGYSVGLAFSVVRDVLDAEIDGCTPDVTGRDR